LKHEITIITQMLSQQQNVLCRLQSATFGKNALYPGNDVEAPNGHGESRQPRYRPRAPGVYYDADEDMPYGRSHIPRRQDEPNLLQLPGTNSIQQKIPPNRAPGLVLQDSLALIDRRRRQFDELRVEAIELGDWVSRIFAMVYFYP
jgi:hypothetical protein